ncbi:hypothetical protein VTK26DRAFT_3511 [Humicola hyalothermophila]
MPSYTVTEPHPTVPQNSYTHSGRGGAGNFFRAPATTSPQGVPTPAITSTTSSSSSTTTTSSSSTSTRRFYAGRGGAGNAVRSPDAAAAANAGFLFDEEYARAEAREQSGSVGHVGRGGAGNIFRKGPRGDADGGSLARVETGSSSGSSSSDGASEKIGGFWGRVKEVVVGH